MRLAFLIVATALPYSALAQDADFLADAESLEACVLETAAAGERYACIGLLQDGCQDLRACQKHELDVWAHILRQNFECDLPLEICPEFTILTRAMSRKVIECERNGPSVECWRDRVGVDAVDTLLKAEAD